MAETFVNVAVPVALFETYIYRLDTSKFDINEDDLIGRRVLVPFKNTKHTGIIVDVVGNLPKVNFKIKEIENIPDKYPIYSKDYIEIIEKLSNYYLSPLGMSLYYGMPEPLRWEYDTKTKKWKAKYLNPVYFPLTNNIDSVNIKSKKAKELLNILISKGDLSLEEIKELGFSKKTIDYLIEKNLVKKADLYFKDISYDTALKSKAKIYSYGEKELKKGIFLYNVPNIEDRFNKYINMIANLIYKNKSALIIFPNIQSLKEAYRRLRNIFGEKVYIYFDGLPDKEKVKTWFNLKNMQGLVCLGTFSSVFIPIKNLSLLIIEEEHSNNYKMLRTPHFDIRRFGIEIFNKFKNLTLLFSSSVPSVESVYLNQKGYIKKFSSRKINLKANFKIVDVNYSEIIEFLKDNISLKEKSLILVNRTGLASFLKCRDCNTEIECPRCKIPLKVFKDNYLRCQICGKKYEYPTKCPKCEGKLISFGFGVEKIKENLNKIFPNKVSYLIETDKNTPVKLTTTINDKDLIIPKFDKVINIYPDIFLRNSYKADEEFFRNIYLSYIKAKKEFILLTKYKEHSAIKYIRENKIENFYTEELEKRKLLEYPPFVNYILLIFEKRNLYLEDVEELFNNWIKKFNIENIDYEGVYFSNIPYARERYRYSILLKNFKEKSYLKELFNMANKKGIKLTIDVSPRKI